MKVSSLSIRKEEMGETLSLISFLDIPTHVILHILTSGLLRAIDLANIKLTSKNIFGLKNSSEYKSLADEAASRLCSQHPIYSALCLIKQRELVARFEGNWIRVLNFVQSIVESWDLVKTSSGNMQVTSGNTFKMVINNSKVHSCASSGSLSNRFGVLGRELESGEHLRLKPVDLPFSAQVIQVSVSDYNSAFLIQSGEVFTCGLNYLFACGHLDTSSPLYKPQLVEALNTTPCKQVATGDDFSVFLTREGHVYTVGVNDNGQLGHGDTMNRKVPTIVESLKNIGRVVHISAGPHYVLAVTEDGSVYSFGDGFNFCHGNGDMRKKLLPHAIQAFKDKGVHILRVCAGHAHCAAIDSNGYVYTWGKGSTGALGHGDRDDRFSPEIVLSLKHLVAVQVSARQGKTYVLVEGGLVYGFGNHHHRVRDPVEPPWVVECFRRHRVLQVTTSMSHTVVITQEGKLLLTEESYDYIQSSLEPIEMLLNC